MDHHGLNPGQRQFVETVDRNIVLMAPAGTGKTNALSYRIAHILAKGLANPNEILCLTFTNRACKEMRERIQTVLGDSAKCVEARTFHSFCYAMIKAEARRLTDLPPDLIIFDEEDCKELLAGLLPAGREASRIQKVLDFLKEKRIAYSNHDYRQILQRATRDDDRQFRELCLDARYSFDNDFYRFVLKEIPEICTAYDRALLEQHGLDFADLMIRANELLQDSQVRIAWQTKYKFFLLDEVQDTNLIEYGIISTLFADQNVVICGDLYQTIYEWRGSQPKKVLQLFRHSHNPVEIRFTQNYRATPLLLQAAEGYLERAFGASCVVRCIAATPSGSDRIILKSAQTIEDEGSWIFNRISAAGKDEQARTVILTRNNRLNQQLSKVFAGCNARIPEARRIGFLLVDEYRFFRRQEIKDILAYLKLLANPFDIMSLKRILQKFAKGIGQQTMRAFEDDKFRRMGISITDLLHPDQAQYGDPYYRLLNDLDHQQVVLFDVETTGTDKTLDEVVQIAAIRVDRNGRNLAEFIEYIRPSRQVGASETVHHLSDQFLKQHGGNPRDVFVRFLRFIENSILVGHNVKFDIDIVSSQLVRVGLPSLEDCRYFDTLEMSRRFYPALANHKLETLCAHFQTSAKSTHDAMADICATRDVMLCIVEEKIRPGLKMRSEIYLQYIDRFAEIRTSISKLKTAAMTVHVPELVDMIIGESGIRREYRTEPDRLKYIEDFRQIIRQIHRPELGAMESLIDLLQITALSNSELDRFVARSGQIPIITVHQAKGCEFDTVYLAGLQDYIFPSYPAIREDKLDEEARTFYVAITRAKKRLYLSWARRDERGEKRMSRFISQIPEKFIMLG